MDRYEALNILSRCQVKPGANFYTLTTSQVSDLCDEADRVKYRKPKNANGSRGRYFHAFVQRCANREAR